MLRVTHKAPGTELRRDAYEVVVDGERIGSVEMSDMVEVPVETGHHTVEVRRGRRSSRPVSFDPAEGETVSFRWTEERFSPIFLASFVIPRLPLKLVRA